jgi:hypothetical protein
MGSATLGEALRVALMTAWATSEEEYHRLADLASEEGLDLPSSSSSSSSSSPSSSSSEGGMGRVVLRQWAGGRLIPLVEQEDPQAEEGDSETKLDVPCEAGWPRLWDACLRRELTAMQLTSTILERARQALCGDLPEGGREPGTWEPETSEVGKWSGWYGPLNLRGGDAEGVRTSWADLFHLWSLRLTFTQPARAPSWAALFGLNSPDGGPWTPTVLAWTLRMELWVDWDEAEDGNEAGEGDGNEAGEGDGKEDEKEDEDAEEFEPSKVVAAWSWELNPLLRTVDQPWGMGWVELRNSADEPTMWTTPLREEVQPRPLGEGASGGDREGAWRWRGPSGASGLRTLAFNLEWSAGTQQAWLAGDGQEGSALFHPPLFASPR